MKGQELRKAILKEMNRHKVDKKRLRRAYKIKWPKSGKLLGSSMKVEKGEKLKVLTAILYMSPEKESVPWGGRNLCVFASNGCAEACLGHTAGRMKMSIVKNSRLWKSLLWIYRPDLFKKILYQDLQRHLDRAKAKGFTCAVRLNGTSDVLWEVKMPELFTDFPLVQFYDYTKVPYRFNKELPLNYHLTFSRSEVNHEDTVRILDSGHNVAIVFSDLNKAIKEGWNGHEVFSADETDYRPGDPKGIAGLSVKGFVKDETGFIIQN